MLTKKQSEIIHFQSKADLRLKVDNSLLFSVEIKDLIASNLNINDEIIRIKQTNRTSAILFNYKLPSFKDIDKYIQVIYDKKRKELVTVFLITENKFKEKLKNEKSQTNNP